MSNLAILGHATMGNDVIGLLKMLGGVNKHNYTADCESLYFYVDGRTSVIYYDWVNCPKTNIFLFTLEDFLAKFPYKVGDMIIADMIGKTEIVSMKWNESQEDVYYGVKGCDVLFTTDCLQPYTETDNLINTLKETQQVVREGNENLGKVIEKLKREDMEETMKTITIEDFKANTKEWLIDKLHDMLISDAVKAVGNLYDELHKPQYPKTYQDCCNVLGLDATFEEIQLKGYKMWAISNLKRVIICRDAYWRLWGVKGANPDYSSIKVNGRESILMFPTSEMRDIFYENFKDLINECKELL